MAIGVGFQVSGDAGQFLAEMKKVQAAQEANIAKLSKQTQANAAARAEQKASAEVARATAKADRERQVIMARGEKLAADLQTAEERYASALAEATKLQEAGAISTETLARRTDQLQQELREATRDLVAGKGSTCQVKPMHSRLVRKKSFVD